MTTELATNSNNLTCAAGPTFVNTTLTETGYSGQIIAETQAGYTIKGSDIEADLYIPILNGNYNDSARITVLGVIEISADAWQYNATQ